SFSISESSLFAIGSLFTVSTTVNTTLPMLVDGTFTPLITLISYDFGSVHFALTSKCGRSIFFAQSPPHVIPSLRAIAPALTSVATSYSELGGHTAMSHANREVWRLLRVHVTTEPLRLRPCSYK